MVLLLEDCYCMFILRIRPLATNELEVQDKEEESITADDWFISSKLLGEVEVLLLKEAPLKIDSAYKEV